PGLEVTNAERGDARFQVARSPTAGPDCANCPVPPILARGVARSTGSGLSAQGSQILKQPVLKSINVSLYAVEDAGGFFGISRGFISSDAAAYAAFQYTDTIYLRTNAKQE